MTAQGENLSLGHKIRNFRIRAKVSQFKLEDLVGMSPGSLSRIETGLINPTKETIILLAKALKLNDGEIASLFSLNVYDGFELLEIVNNFSERLDSEEAIQIAIDEIAEKMNIRNVSILLLKNKTLHG